MWKDRMRVQLVSKKLKESNNDSGGSKGGAPGARPPMFQNFLNFMQFFGKFAKIIGLCLLPGGLAQTSRTENLITCLELRISCSLWLILRNKKLGI